MPRSPVIAATHVSHAAARKQLCWFVATAGKHQDYGPTATTGRGTYCTKLASRKRPAGKHSLSAALTLMLQHILSWITGFDVVELCFQRNGLQEQTDMSAPCAVVEQDAGADMKQHSTSVTFIQGPYAPTR